jgi:deoxyribonuclease-4
VQAFHQEIVRATALGADFLVLHPGNSLGAPVDSAISAIADGLKQATRSSRPGELQILLENTAGQGSSIGSKFPELRAIIDGCPELNLGVCIDTAHLFAMGWDIRTANGLDAALREIDRTVGLHRVLVVHVNDSKMALGTKVDRHEHIGKGKIGIEAFRMILKHPLLAACAFILETPIDLPGDDKRNVAALWRLTGRVVEAKGTGMKPRRKRQITGKTMIQKQRKKRPRGK